MSVSIVTSLRDHEMEREQYFQNWQHSQVKACTFTGYSFSGGCLVTSAYQASLINLL